MVSLPIVDLRSFNSQTALAETLVRIGKEHGFFYLTGHGIAQKDIEEAFQLTESFFLDTKLEDKNTWANGSGDIVGRQN